MKVVIIGTAGHADLALVGLGEHRDAKLAGIAPGSPDEDISAFTEKCKQEFPGVAIYDDYPKMLDEVKPDVACVSPCYHLHASINVEVMSRGIHCFSEKPVAVTLEGLAKVREAHEQAVVEFAAMQSLRYNPAILSAHKAVAEGAIGIPLLITAQKSYKLGTRPAFYKKRELFGGIIPWVGAHSIDWIYWFSGSVPAAVFAAHTTAGNHGHGELESSAVCCFTLANGGQASTNIDFFQPGAAATHGDDRLRVAGEKGVVEVKDGKAILTTHDSGPKQLPLEPRRCFFAEFLEQTDGCGKCLVSAEASFDVTEICLKARQSADEGLVVPLK